jgi:cytochrome bd-type quinol oxidase subunit 1
MIPVGPVLRYRFSFAIAIFTFYSSFLILALVGEIQHPCRLAATRENRHDSARFESKRYNGSSFRFPAFALNFRHRFHLERGIVRDVCYPQKVFTV